MTRKPRWSQSVSLLWKVLAELWPGDSGASDSLPAESLSCRWFLTAQMKSLTPPLILTHTVFCRSFMLAPANKRTVARLPAWRPRPNQTIWPGYATLTTVTFAVLLSLCSSGSAMQTGETWVIFPPIGELSKGGNSGWRWHGLLSLMSKLSNHLWKQSFRVGTLILFDHCQTVQCSC